MLTSMKDQAVPRRRNRVYGTHEVPSARLSGLSMVSNITGVSSSSAESSSTVVQDPHARPKQPSERKRKPRRRSVTNEKMDGPVVDAGGDRKEVDVFKFLVGGAKPPKTQTETEKTQTEREKAETETKKTETEREKAETETEISETETEETRTETEVRDTPAPNETGMTGLESVTLQKQELVCQPEEPDLEGYYRSQISDSGLSMRSSVSEPHPDSVTKHPLPPLIEEVADQSIYGDYPTYAPSTIDPYYQHEYQVWGHYGGTGYTSEPTPLSPASMRSYAYPHEYAYRGTPDLPSTGESSVTCLDSTPLVFRDRAMKATPHPRLFRTFAKISAQMLLQMQSNISELEHELALLDAKTISAEASAKHKKIDHNNGRHSTKDQSLRAELYQELYTSLEQYYESLSSFHKISQITSPCTTAETSAFKSWLRTHTSPSSRVAALVGDGSDLIRFGQPPDDVSDLTLRLIAYVIFTNVFFPLLLFKLTLGILSRLILLSFITTASTLVLDRHRAQAKVELGKLHLHCVLGSACVSLVAALFF